MSYIFTSKKFIYFYLYYNAHITLVILLCSANGVDWAEAPFWGVLAEQGKNGNPRMGIVRGIKHVISVI